MSTPPTTSSREEVGRLGREAFARLTRDVLKPEDNGKYVAIDVDSGDYEIDASDYAAVMRLRSRRPGARSWLAQAGQRGAYRFGYATSPR